MGLFSLPADDTVKAKVQCAIRNLELWRDHGGGDYLLMIAKGMIEDALEKPKPLRSRQEVADGDY